MHAVPMDAIFNYSIQTMWYSFKFHDIQCSAGSDDDLKDPGGPS